MGFQSANHLINAVKGHPVERSFAQYIDILKPELLAHHQITLDDDLIARLRSELVQS